MKSLFAALTLLLALALLPLAEAGKKSKTLTAKEGLQEIQDFIGEWQDKGSRESVNWNWRFKGEDVWLSFDMKGSKYYKGGEVRYLSDKAKYAVTMIDKKDAKKVFEGGLVKSVMVLERLDPKTGDTEQLKINTAADGDRLVYTMLVRPDGRTLFNRVAQTGYTKEGVTFGSEPGSKRPECVVTFGLGTMPVSFNGMTYYVCCSGCRDAFDENPAKIIAEFNAKKKKKA